MSRKKIKFRISKKRNIPDKVLKELYDKGCFFTFLLFFTRKHLTKYKNEVIFSDAYKIIPILFPYFIYSGTAYRSIYAKRLSFRRNNKIGTSFSKNTKGANYFLLTQFYSYAGESFKRVKSEVTGIDIESIQKFIKLNKKFILSQIKKEVSNKWYDYSKLVINNEYT